MPIFCMTGAVQGWKGKKRFRKTSFDVTFSPKKNRYIPENLLFYTNRPPAVFAAGGFVMEHGSITDVQTLYQGGYQSRAPDTCFHRRMRSRLSDWKVV